MGSRTVALTMVFTALFLTTSPSLVYAQSGSRGGSARLIQQQRARQQQVLQQQRLQQQRQAALQRREAQLRRERQEIERRERQLERESEERRAEDQRRKGVVVVELFTSQGCSSCPSADAALKQIADVAENRNLAVYPLSFHVDYWNRLGWDDPYSQKDFTTRQATYAAKQQGNNIYTPQMIVNGTDQFVGSDKNRAHQSISAALQKSPKTTVKAEVTEANDRNQLTIRYRISGDTKEKALNFALVQSPKENSIDRGENAGRTLGHVNVVRAFKVIVPEGTSGAVELDLPEDFDASLESKLVAYAQEKSTYEIVGASVTAVQNAAASPSTNQDAARQLSLK